MKFFNQFAAETAQAEADIFTALGIDWRLLIVQIVAFLILVFLLGKFVYPWLMKSVDERQAAIDAANKAAAKAQKLAEENEDKVTQLLETAKKEAAEIVATAKSEATDIVSKSEERAQKSAKQIVSAAHEQIEKDIERAKKELFNETLELVATATEKVTKGLVKVKASDELVKRSVKEDV